MGHAAEAEGCVTTGGSHGGEGAVVGVVSGEQGGVLHEHSHGFQDKCDEELNVNEVPGAAQPPVK